MQLWQHLLNKKRNKEAAHSMNLHFVEAACIDNWSLLEQQASKPNDQKPTELDPPVKVEAISNPPVKVEAISNPPVKVEAISNTPVKVEAMNTPPVKVEFIPPPKLIGVCTMSQKALIYMPDSGCTHQQPLQHGPHGLAVATAPDGQVLTTLCPNSK
eukprot:191238-Amphidinium_carterae.1